MSKGYLVLAQNNKTDNYINHAYALALSIKNTQSTVNNITLATDVPVDNIPPNIQSTFDSIVPIPWTDHAEASQWKIENKWKYYHMTPYDETVILDADMIFPTDISHWWDILSKQDIWITDKPRTFKGEIITSTRYRETFVSNNLPNVYTAFMYFKKTEMVAELFRLVEIIFNNWNKFYYDYLDETRPNVLSGDVAYALAIKILGIENECFGNIDSMPTFVHMKSHLQNIDAKFLAEDWTNHIPTYFREDCGFKIGNYEQTLPFHYHIKSWLTPDIIAMLENRGGVV
jgi:hypothetical protein